MLFFLASTYVKLLVPHWPTHPRVVSAVWQFFVSGKGKRFLKWSHDLHKAERKGLVASKSCHPQFKKSDRASGRVRDKERFLKDWSICGRIKVGSIVRTKSKVLFMNRSIAEARTGGTATLPAQGGNQVYDEQTIQAVWLKAKPAPGWASFRKDAGGAVIHRRMYGVPDKWGWRIVHIQPLENGGSNDVDNLQALHWDRLDYRNDAKGS